MKYRDVGPMTFPPSWHAGPPDPPSDAEVEALIADDEAFAPFPDADLAAEERAMFTAEGEEPRMTHVLTDASGRKLAELSGYPEAVIAAAALAEAAGPIALNSDPPKSAAAWTAHLDELRSLFA